jgi:hypothetical protein
MTLGGLVMQGFAGELSYMSDADALTARTLERELLADAAAGVDLRARLIGAACSPASEAQ